MADEYDAIVINEFMASNSYAIMAPDLSDFPDWIELYNRGDAPVQLGGLFLTDNLNKPMKWRIPEGMVIDPRGFLVVWADGSNRENHTNFKLNCPSEEIGLFRPDGRVIDFITYNSQLSDISFGRYPDGESEWMYFVESTLSGPNGTRGVNEPIRVMEPEFSVQGGFYSGLQSVTLTCTPHGSIRYTTDGSVPKQSSDEYTIPIQIDKTTVIRARADAPAFLPSRVVTHTFFIDESSTLPIISIATDPDFLFDDTVGITVGICVNDSIRADPPFDPHANFWHDWERPISYEFYEQEGHLGFKMDAGIKIFGGAFGRQIRQKAFSIFTRDKYGTHQVRYPMFPTKSIDTFRRWILRCSSNDFNMTFFRDAMMQKLTVDQMDVDYQAYQPAIMFLNGQYWGLYNIREKMNEHYPESNYGIDPNEVDLLENIGEVGAGDPSHFENLIDFVKSNDMALPDNYAYVKTQMDVDEFMNYQIAEIYYRNHDWLHRNTKYWRERGPQGRWRWMLFDLDWGFGGETREGEQQYRTNSLEWALNQGEASILLSRLLDNLEFKHAFAQRFASHLNLTFNPERVIHIIDGIRAQIEPEMERHIDRWGAIADLDYWEREIEILRVFARERPDFVRQHINETLSLQGITTLTVRMSGSGSGRVNIGDMDLRDSLFTGLYFKHAPVRLIAKPDYGSQFMRWEGYSDGSSDTLTVILSGSDSVKAIFERVDLSPIVINEIHYNPSSFHQGSDDNYEFVELFNRGDADIDLSHYRFTRGIGFIFPSGTTIRGGEYIIIAKNSSTYRNQEFQVFQSASGKLANEGEALCLFDGENHRIDSVNYDDTAPWPPPPDGDGPSLELIDASKDNVLPGSWRASEQVGGTPGRSNGSETGVEEVRLPLLFKVYPNTPNPFNSQTMFIYDLPQRSHVHMEIKNILGQQIRILVDEMLEPGRHHVPWNGSDDAGHMVTSGMYIVKVQTRENTYVGKLLMIR